MNKDKILAEKIQIILDKHDKYSLHGKPARRPSLVEELCKILNAQESEVEDAIEHYQIGGSPVIYSETDNEIAKRVMSGYWEEQRGKDFHDDWVSPADWLEQEN